MRIALIGAVESSQVALETMLQTGHDPDLVLGLQTASSARHSDYVDLGPIAKSSGVEYRPIKSVNDQAVIADLRDRGVDYTFVIGWSQICGPEFLAAPRSGGIGFHPSRLPENRGRAVVPWTILQGKSETGATLFWLGSGVDDGDILAQEEFTVAPDETARTLYDKHLRALEVMLKANLPELERGSERRTPQDHAEATYCARRTPEDGLIDWTMTAAEIDRLIRATTRPYPGAFTHWRETCLRIWSSAVVAEHRHWAVPGQVVELTSAGPLVMCGNRSLLLLKEASANDQGPLDWTRLRLHEKLGRKA